MRAWLSAALVCAGLALARPSAAHLALPHSQAMLMAGWDTLVVELDASQPYVGRRFATFVTLRPEQRGAHDDAYTLTLSAEPGLGIAAVRQRGHLVRAAGSPYAWTGDIAIPTRGGWGLRMTVQRPDGETHTADLPITVAAPNAIPVWEGWCVGLSPLLGLLAFAVWQARELLRQLREEEADGPSRAAA